MATTQNTFTGDGSNLGPFSFTFKWLEPTDIKVTVAGVLKTVGTHYNLQSLNYATKTGGQVLFTAGNAPANGAAIVVYRQTDDTDLAATFYSGSAIRAQDLNNNFIQGLYVTQESSNNASTAITTANSTTTTANTALSNSTTAISTANSAVSTANTASSNASAAVSTANTAATNASTALSTANTANTNASAAVTTANTAASNASTALSTANTAASNASAAVTTANTALSTANAASATATTAATNAATAVSTANTANSNAAAALTAVANSVQYQLVANVAAIPGTPADGDAVEVANSTGIESFSPLANRPAGFVGDTGLSVRMQYTSAGSTWNWLNYFAIDSDTRYLKKSGGTLTGALTLNADPTQNLQAATKQYVDSVANAGGLPLTGGTMTGQILGDNSTSPTTPGYAFDGDANTGLYTTGADELALATGGSARLTIDAAGNVAVLGTLSQGGNNVLTTSSLSTSTSSTSTTTAATSSAVKSAYDLASTANTTATTANTTANAALPKAGGAMTGDLTLNAQSDLRFADADSSNWVAFQGPATVASNVTWTLPSTDGTANQVLSTNGSGTLSWATAAAGATDKIEEGDTSAEVIDTGSDGRFVVTTQGAERLRVDSSGRLLVGTSSARSNVYVGGANPVPNVQFESVGNNYNAGLSLINYSALGFSPLLTLGLSLSNTAGANAAVSADLLYGIINFVGNDGTNFRTGASIVAACDGAVSTGDLPTRLVFSTTADGASSPTERMRITSAGEILLNKTSDTLANAGWAVNTNGRGQLTCSVDGAPVLRLNQTGSGGTQYPIEFFKNGSQVGSVSITASATSYNTSSDYRLKENVVLLTGAVDRLLQIPVHRFNFIADPDHTVDGFIAHEAQAVVPECVTGEKDAVDDDGNPVYQGIDQSKLVPLLTAALQEAMERIETLEAKVAALEGV